MTAYISLNVSAFSWCEDNRSADADSQDLAARHRSRADTQSHALSFLVAPVGPGSFSVHAAPAAMPMRAGASRSQSPRRATSESVELRSDAVTPTAITAATLLQGVEAERQRIGADLHDEVGQLLTGITCLSTALMARLRGRDDLAAEDAVTIAEAGREALSRIRAIAHGLTPACLARHGLVPALEELRAQVRRMQNVEVELHFPQPPVAFDAETTAHLFRIAQEAIANALRHGAATCIHVSLRRTSDQYHFVIVDNGRGFDSHQPGDAPGAGLGLMEYRAGLLHGRFVVNSDPATGTRIEISFPPHETCPQQNAC